MNRTPAAVLAAVLAGLSAPVASSAQAEIYVAGGLTVPAGEYSAYAQTGWITQAGIRAPVGDAGLGWGAEAFLGRNNHEPPPEGDKSFLYGATGSVIYAFGDRDGAHPYLLGTAGLLTESFRSDVQPGLDGTEASLAAGAGAGIAFPVGDMGGYVSAWFLNGFRHEGDTRLFGVTTGLSLPLAQF